MLRNFFKIVVLFLIDLFVWPNTGQSPNDASVKNAIHFLKSKVHMLAENVHEGEPQPETLEVI